jgi:hypothetical protein
MECNELDAQGNATELTFRRYRRLAEGGAGIIFVESLTINYENRARKNQLKISEETAPGLERLVKAMREINEKPLILFQINHSGRHSNAAFSKVVPLYPTGDQNVHLLTEKEYAEKNLKDGNVDLVEIRKTVPCRPALFKEDSFWEYRSNQLLYSLWWMQHSSAISKGGRMYSL